MTLVIPQGTYPQLASNAITELGRMKKDSALDDNEHQNTLKGLGLQEIFKHRGEFVIRFLYGTKIVIEGG